LIENEGMAWGKKVTWTLWKLFLTVFRPAAVTGNTYFGIQEGRLKQGSSTIF
jgi:hypothetical protein